MTRIIKAFDAISRHFLVPVASLLPIRQAKTDNPRSILVIRPGGIGDAVHLLPVIRLLREIYCDSRIEVLAEKRNAELLRISTDVDMVRCYDVPWEFLPVFANKYDIVIDTEQWHRLSAVVARITRAPSLVGFATNDRRNLLTDTVDYSHDDYEVNSFLNLLRPLGISGFEMRLPWFSIPVLAAQKAFELLYPLDNTPFVTIFPGASIPERRWSAERFATVAQFLSNEGIPTVVVGTGEDAAMGAAIIRGLSAMNLAGKTSLQETAAIIERCSVLVSGDSGILHIGVGLGIPTVSLFGPGIAAKWAPRGDTHIVINKHLSCSPCTRFGTTPTCKTGAHCIADISPDEVYAAVISLLNRKTP